jgi:MinD-like ATPase involved in chromosome partitioning or flagellar assembly
VARALDLKPDALLSLPEVGAGLVRHVNSGTPIVQADPRSTLARGLQHLATALAPGAGVAAGARR